MYEDCCYNTESQKSTERNTTSLHAYCALLLVFRTVDAVSIIQHCLSLQCCTVQHPGNGFYIFFYFSLLLCKEKPQKAAKQKYQSPAATHSIQQCILMKDYLRHVTLNLYLLVRIWKTHDVFSIRETVLIVLFLV